MSVDFGKTAGDYGRHRAGFPPSLFDRLEGFGIGLPGQRLLDLGTGTGSLARGFAQRGCESTGLDPSEAMLEEARRLDREAGVGARYIVGRAEDVGLPTGSLDVVTAGQCWHWFDRRRAAREVRRLLVPGGRIVIAHFDWVPLPGNVAQATEDLFREHNPGWRTTGGAGGLYPAWLSDLATTGFGGLETFSYDVAVPYTHEAWRGRTRASAGVGASLGPDAVRRFDRDLADLLRERFPGDPLEIPHRVFAVVGAAPL